MPASKRLSLILIATLPLLASVSEARADQAAQAPALQPPKEQVSMPDEARIASDLQGHTRFAGVATLDARPVGADETDSTAIRSSVRSGDVLEFRVTTMYQAGPNGAPRREVDSIVSYQLNATGWALIGVKTEDTRNLDPNPAGTSGEPC